MKFKLTHTFYFLPIIFLSTISFPQNEWKVLNSPTNELLRFLHFVDEDFGVAAGRNGIILRTTNGGIEWSVLNTGVTSSFYDVFFLDDSKGWALTFPTSPPFFTKIINTTNGGDTWKTTNYVDEYTFFRTIFFLDSLTGFMGGDYIAKTTDGGANWARMNIDSSMLSGYPIIKIKFFDDQIGYACGGALDQAGVMWRTSDGGENWYAEGVSPDEVFDFYIKDSLNVIALSGDPEWIYPMGIVRSSNAGLAWTFTETELYHLSFALDFRTQTEGWSASGFDFLVSQNGGDSWEIVNTPDSSIIWDLQFINDTIGFACGQNGILLKYIGSTVSVPYVPNISIGNFELDQNYPNPFNSGTKIKYYVPTSINGESITSIVKIEVYDVLGKKIVTLLNDEKVSGNYEIQFDGQNFSSGVYYYTLISGDFRQTKKMILLR